MKPRSDRCRSPWLSWPAAIDFMANNLIGFRLPMNMSISKNRSISSLETQHFAIDSRCRKVDASEVLHLQTFDEEGWRQAIDSSLLYR